MLKSLNVQLRSRGIDLLVVPVPAKEHVNGLFILDNPPEDGVLNPYRLFLFKRLLDAGVEVMDLQPSLTLGWSRFKHVYYDALDHHPADGAIQIAAEQIAARIARYGFKTRYRGLRKVQVPLSIPDRYTRFPDHAKLPGAYTATRVMIDGTTPLPEEPKSASPVLLLCDSFGGVPAPYGVRNAALPVHLAAEMGFRPRTFRVEGGAPQMLVHLSRADPAILRGVRVCVFFFNEMYLYRDDPETERLRWQVAELPAAPLRGK
jgi:alginate O-acetyltransferase complex protein AlgJ